MSFKKFLTECDDLEALNVEEGKSTQLTDYIKQIEELNNDTFREFAVNELGMSDAEAETVVYKMLRDYLLKDDEAQVMGDELPVDLDAELGGLDDEDEIVLDLDAEVSDLDGDEEFDTDDDDFNVEIDDDDLGESTTIKEAVGKFYSVDDGITGTIENGPYIDVWSGTPVKKNGLYFVPNQDFAVSVPVEDLGDGTYMTNVKNKKKILKPM